jgi:uncharacterized protein (TIGR03437 family)
VAVRPGDEVVLSATGFGPADPAPRVRVWIDTVEAEVVSAAYSAPGIFDVHIKIPELKVGDYPVTADVDGVRTTKFVRIPVQPRDE